MGDILRKTEVSFVSFLCIVQTLCQVIIELTVPICHLDFKKRRHTSNRKKFTSK